VAGLYSLTVTDSEGCSVAINDINVTDDCPPPNCVDPVLTSVVVIEPHCGASDGSITVNVFGGPTGFSYTWTPNVSTTHIASNIPAGVYTVVIQDLSQPGCPGLTATITVANIDGPDVEIVDQTPATCNASNGTVTMSPANLTYEWGNGATGPMPTNLPAGPCQVTITDPVSGCIDYIEVVIAEENPLVVTAAVTNTPDCGVANGSVTINTDPTGTYNYIWNDGGSTETRNNLSSGMYSVTVTEVGGNECEGTVSFTLLDAVPGQATVTITGVTPESCPGA